MITDVKRYAWFTSTISWLIFIPYNLKTCILSLSGISFSCFFVPAVPGIILHSALYAYIGIYIPDFSNLSDSNSILKSLENTSGVQVLILLAIVSFTKVFCFFYAFFIHRKSLKDRNENKDKGVEDCDDDDGNTCVNLTLTLGSGLVDMNKKASSAQLDRSLDDSLSSYNNRSLVLGKKGLSNVSTTDEAISQFESKYRSENLIKNFLKNP